MIAAQLNVLAARVHTANAKWWVDLETGAPLTRNIGELLMLVVSELAEALEGHRKNLHDDKLPHRKMIEVELADAVIRLLDIAGGLSVTFQGYEALEAAIMRANAGENLLVIVILCGHAYRDRGSPTLFSTWLESAIHAIEDLSFRLSLDLYGALEEKLAYNAVRHDHTIEGRKQVNGKKY